ncbi:MAG TPA: serine/threonine-protein kinase [Pirellulales bacterium]
MAEIHGASDADFDVIIDRFERAWQSGGTPRIAGFFNPVAVKAIDRQALLYELVRVDLEYRWKSPGLHDCERRTLDDYLPLLPELASEGEVPIGLIAEEYRVRRRWGNLEDADELLRRYPQQCHELTPALLQVDEEIERESEPRRAESLPSGSRAQTLDLDGIPQYEQGDFVLQVHLGSGGIGKVYRAWWKSRKVHIALKMLRKAWWRQPGADDLFFREAAVLFRLRHKHIVQVHGIGRTDKGGCFLVIDLIDGNDLSQYVGTRMAVATALDWVAQAADALAHAHREGVVHRDVKPGNLLLDGSGRIHVADFGLALAPAARLDGIGEIAGTVSYMAPEQLFGHDRVSPRADLFSLGAVLHALLHGRPPDAGGPSPGTVRHAPNAPEKPRDLAPAVETILSRCLAFDPNERFADADELAKALRAEARRIGEKSTPATHWTAPLWSMLD